MAKATSLNTQMLVWLILKYWLCDPLVENQLDQLPVANLSGDYLLLSTSIANNPPDRTTPK